MNTVSFRWTDTEVRTALGLSASGGERDFTGISTDSRDLEAGNLFVALVGTSFDAHDFVDQAVAGGAAGVVVSREVEVPPRVAVYRVPDTLVALGQLARHRRRALPARVVGITGSTGKTTTKEFLRAALTGSFRVHANRGNLNNRIGVPLTLLEAPEDAEVVITEMGTNEPGEIARLAAIAVPDVGMVTTVSESHLEKLGSVQGVLVEKLDLVRGLGPDAVAIVGETPDSLPEAAREIRGDVGVAGLTARADARFRATELMADPGGRHRFRWQDTSVTLSVPGRHMVSNAVMALAGAAVLGVPAEVAARGVESLQPRGMRGEERRVGPLTLILDCYNANPQSTRAALDTLASRAATGPRVAILGSMLELGTESTALHGDVLAHALSLELERVVATGAFAAAAPSLDDPSLLREEDPESAYLAVRGELAPGALVLLKASRGVALERLLPLFEADFGEGGD